MVFPHIPIRDDDVFGGRDQHFQVLRRVSGSYRIVKDIGEDSGSYI